MTAPDLVAASLVVIRAGQAPTGAFVAGPTFSQYGFAWLRDGAFIAEALDIVGRHEDAARFHEWVAGIVHRAADGMERAITTGRLGRRPDPADYLHCRYTTDGSVGPGDWPTFQLDGPGIWLWSLGRHIAAGGSMAPRVLRAALRVGAYLAALWQVPSSDAWEEFPDKVHTSTLAADLAGLRAVLDFSDEARADRVIRAAAAGLADRLQGQGRGSGAWTKWDGSDAVDASLLWVAAPYALVPPTSERFAATLARIESELVSPDGGVHRYADDTYYGGGEWILLTAGLGRVYLRRNEDGDRERAIGCLRWIEAQATLDGALPEQVATRALHPESIEGWRATWGESACPLLWSHASYLALHAELTAGDERSPARRIPSRGPA